MQVMSSNSGSSNGIVSDVDGEYVDDFLRQSNDLIKNLSTASFVSIDEEMTGISLPPPKNNKDSSSSSKRRHRISKDESPSQRYSSSMKPVPERYSIIQLGICLFEYNNKEKNDGDDTATNNTNTAAGSDATSAADADGGDNDVVDTASFRVRKYKFTLFPPSDPRICGREITLNPSSIHFLVENNMDLNKWAKDGIPYCTGEEATNLAEKFLKHQKYISSPPKSNHDEKGGGGGHHRKIVLTKDDDKEFHARVFSSLREWLDTPIVGGTATTTESGAAAEGVSFLLPRCNSFLRRALYESIQKDYPYLVLETVEGNQIRVWRLTDDERRRRNQRLLVEGFRKLILKKIGMQRVFLALSKACSGEPINTQAEHVILAHDANEAIRPFVPGKERYLLPKKRRNKKLPLVVHNGMMDLLFLMTHFHSTTLPDDWYECKRLIHSYFPVIYDTKIMASDYCLSNANGTNANVNNNNNAPNFSRGRTRLEDVYTQVVADYPQWKKLLQQSQQQDDDVNDHAHDAAYDAYMTGICFCGLSYTIHDQIKIPPVESASKFQLWDCDNNIYDDDDDDDEEGNSETALLFPRTFYGRNKLYFHLSPYTIDMESSESDPLGRGMSHESTFSVSNIDPSVTSSDIISTLSSLSDSRNQRVNFDIIWVDDTTFLVGAQILNAFHEDDERFKEHGTLLETALKARFKSVSYLLDSSSSGSGDKRNDNKDGGGGKNNNNEKNGTTALSSKKRSIFNLWGLLSSSSSGGGGNDESTNDNHQNQQRPFKRRRYS